MRGRLIRNGQTREQRVTQARLTIQRILVRAGLADGAAPAAPRGSYALPVAEAREALRLFARYSCDDELGPLLQRLFSWLRQTVNGVPLRPPRDDGIISST